MSGASGDSGTAQAPPLRRLFWSVLHPLFFLFFLVFYGFRAYGVRHARIDGPVLLVCNHQSFFDPVLAGLGTWSRPHFTLARQTLWDNPKLGYVMTRLNAFPVELGAADMKSMRKCIDVLEGNRRLLLFAEGTRTPDGSVQPFAPGVLLLLKRCRPKVLPMAIEGAFDAWPREVKQPSLLTKAKIGVAYGEPIDPEELLKLSSDEALAKLHDEVDRLRQQVRDRLDHRA